MTLQIIAVGLLVVAAFVLLALIAFCHNAYSMYSDEDEG